MTRRPNQAPQVLDLMTPAEAAEQLKIAEKTLTNKRSRREGPPYVRLSGGAIRYSRSAITAWLAERTVTHDDTAVRR